MSQAFLIFEFGTNEEAAQRARHRLEGWRQGFRLGDKLQLWFDRTENEAATAAAGEAAAAKKKATADGGEEKESGAGKHGHLEKAAHAGKHAAAHKKGAAKKAAEENEIVAEAPASVRLYVRLGFSNHEKLSYQRWLERIPTEEPFKDFTPTVVTAGSEEFQSTEDLFQSFKQGELARERSR